MNVGVGGAQVDSHLAELTVKETMDFSARVQGPGTKRGVPLKATRAFRV